MLAVVPKAFEGACILFVDARDLSIPVRASHRPEIYTSLGAVLRLAGGCRPLNLQLEVSGVEGYEAASETFMPKHRALLTVTVSMCCEGGAGYEVAAESGVGLGQHRAAHMGSENRDDTYSNNAGHGRRSALASSGVSLQPHVYRWQPDTASLPAPVEKVPPLHDAMMQRTHYLGS